MRAPIAPRRRFLPLLTAAWTSLATLAGQAAQAAPDWAPAQGPLLTRWAADVHPDRVHPEYPRPQLTRSDWLNLNGLWDYAIAPREGSLPEAWDGRILVPFPVESALSGVARSVGPDRRLWYRRTFERPIAWGGRRLLLHFGAVDWETTVWVNGREVGTHRGGYDAFSFDITDALRPEGAQELVVAVWDPTDAGHQPRGKQVRDPHAIWYTPTTGIWQTVWLEPVPLTAIESLRITPDHDQGTVTVEARIRTWESSTAPASVRFVALDGNRRVATETAPVEPAADGSVSIARTTLTLPDPKAWSPDSPHLYNLRAILRRDRRPMDRVASYFGLRKIEIAQDADGTPRLFLNGEPLFQFGPLDQGFWPDGLYTAPTDEALRYDIEVTRQYGFNMARKHVKIEPARWYYWADRLGLLVWQDMPSGDRYIGSRDPDITRSPESGAQFETELHAMVDGLYNHPSIVMWVPYNEGWGQWDTCRIADLVRAWDPTRLVNSASGWTDRGCGDVHDIHAYPGPDVPPVEPRRAVVLGEFGGLGLPVAGHAWQDERNWGYRSYTTREDLTEAYLALIRKLHPLTGSPGLAAAVYTQTTDVEIEVNGLLTYDRAILKLDPALLAPLHRTLYSPPEPRQSPDTALLIPPSTPLVVCDPYFSIWSPSDRLADEDTVHWTGRPHRLTALVRIDGRTFRLLGPNPHELPPLPQTGLDVLPTRTIATFAGAGIEIALTFLTPMLPEDLDLLSQPVTHITWDIRSTRSAPRHVQLLFEASAEIAVHEPRQEVQWSTLRAGPVSALRVGTTSQPVLGRRGDDVRIDWGHLLLAAADSQQATLRILPTLAARTTFIHGGQLPAAHTGPAPSPAASAPSGFVHFDLGLVGPEPSYRWLLLAYDDEYSIQYMKRNLRPYWRRDGTDAAALLARSAAEHDTLVARCRAFDDELMADLTRVGGLPYAQLAALAYRQGFAASKFVADDHGQPISFSKENFSNGCIGTSDVFYPMAPQFLLFGSSAARSFLVPFMNYAVSERWKFPFAPHDLGTYPHADGQVYGGGEHSEENQMPVEECGNLLILMAAVSHLEGDAGFAEPWWPTLTRWAEYLREHGYDPANQLCTDDFAGHLARNVNLSAKAIVALGAFAQLAERLGDGDLAAEYREVARTFAARWIEEARDPTHYRLAFDRPGTWSQKYNLVWDRLLGLNLFPDSVRRLEMDHYLQVQNTYGLPLDNRADYTKLDWILWTATLTRDRSDFDALVGPVIRWLNETPQRVPMSDWYDTHNARQIGFQARPVVGGVFLEMLHHPDLWAKYAGRDRTRATGYAPMPTPPRVTSVVPTAREDAPPWRHTLRRPPADWMVPAFDDSDWQLAPAGFGTRGTPNAIVRTEWNTRDIWIRRAFELPSDVRTDDLHLCVHHDEDVRVYLNGHLILERSGYTTDYETHPLSPAALEALQPGLNVLAIHCRQTGGGQYIDAGLARVEIVR